MPTTLVLRKASINNVILADSSADVYAVVVGVGRGRVMLFVDHLLGCRQLGIHFIASSSRLNWRAICCPATGLAAEELL
jgi:hypothetical protein